MPRIICALVYLYLDQGSSFRHLQSRQFFGWRGHGQQAAGILRPRVYWASFICVLLNDTVNGVLLPTLSAIQNDVVSVRRWYLKTIDLVAFVAVVANTSLLVNAHYFLSFLVKAPASGVRRRLL